MKDKLLKLHDYLLSNGYIKDADRIYSILEEYENEINCPIFPLKN